ncbi:hypothetical protein GCM10023149_38890 [Mucilaginibacter gynuensis]|uniref:Capsule synthesis protein CapA domain-containing protein n=1 Tax=Mucilaginibacter gynuensis TaxID=1302236 RepID=A0ABP8H160_9SPHI
MKPYLNLLLITLLLSACRFNNEQAQKPDSANVLQNDTATKTVVKHSADSICIAAVGDIMLGTSYPDKQTLPPDSGKNSFKAVADELRSADVTFGNLEGVLLDTGAAAYYKLHQVSKAYLFRMPQHYADILKDAGFDVLSIANNHVGDFGLAGQKSTVKMLDSVGIKYAGLHKYPSTIFKINGVTYGFCAFSPNAPTVSLLDHAKAAAIISELKQQVDVVIVSFHGGGEGTDHEHVPSGPESYKGEHRGDVRLFAHNAIDAGADVVLGHGPHLTRAMEKYNNRFIAYSLGNFCTYKGVNTTGVCGIAPLLKIYINKSGEFLSGRIISTRQSMPGGLRVDTANRVVKRIKMLNAIDIPEAGLNISDSGVITPAG